MPPAAAQPPAGSAPPSAGAEPAQPGTQAPGRIARAKAKAWPAGTGAKIKGDVQGDGKKYLSKLSPVSDPAGAVAGLLAYCLAINGIRYGKAGVTGWLKAKFLNKPMQGAAPAALSTTPTTPTTPTTTPV